MLCEEIAALYASAMSDAVEEPAESPMDTDAFVRFALILQRCLLAAAQKSGTLDAAAPAAQVLADMAARGARMGHDRFHALKDAVDSMGTRLIDGSSG